MDLCLLLTELFRVKVYENIDHTNVSLASILCKII